MSMPQGPTGLEDAAWMSEWVAQDTASQFQNRTKPNVESYYQTGFKLPGPWEFLVDFFSSVFDGLLAAAEAVWNALKWLADALGLDEAWETVKDIADAIGGFIAGGFDDVWEFILGIPIIGDIADFIADILDEVVDMLVLLFTNPLQAVKILWDAFQVFLDNLWDGIVDVFVTLFTNPGELLDRLGDAWRVFVGWIVGELDEVWEWLKDIPILGAALEAVEDLVNTVIGWFGTIADWLGLDKVLDTMEDVVDWIGQTIGGGIKWAQDAFRKVAEWLGLDHIIDGIGDLVDWVGGFISDIAGSVWAGLNGAVTWVGKAVRTGLDAVFNAVARLFGKVDTTDKNAAQMMARLATPGVGGVWQAVSSTDEAAFPHTMVNTSDTLGVLGTERSTFIRVRADRTINAIKVALTEAPKMGQFIVKLYRIDPTPITIEGVSGLTGQVLLDLGDQRGALAAAGDVKTILLPKRISISAGDLIAVAMEQRGGTATKFHCATKNAFPESLHRLSTVLTDGRAFVQTATVMPVAPWVALADVDETQPMPRAFADNFNRSGANTLGPAWLQRRGQLGVREWDFGWFTPKRTSAVPLSGSSVSTQIARMASPDHEVFGVPYSTASGASSLSYLQGRFDGLGNGVAAMLGWWSGRYNVEIRQCTNDYDPRNGVVRASAQVTDYMDFTMFKLMCDGTRYSIWYVNRSGVAKEACYWDDLGKLLPYTDANTEVGIGAYQTGMSSAIDDWAAKDLIKP